MTERPASATHRTRDRFDVGPSSVRHDGDSVVFAFDEMAAPFPKRVRGEVRVTPEFRTPDVYEIDADCQHSWWPIAPRARIEVSCDAPDLAWSGSGYLDMNAGDVPLEETFHSWNWARAHVDDDAAVLYHVLDTKGEKSALAVRFDRSGTPEMFDAPHIHPMRRTGWLVDRALSSDDTAAPRVVQTFEDTPFYSRSLLEARLLGRDVHAVHESLALHRFARPTVKMLLPFRMPRWGHRRATA
ncbi:MAG: hydratase [Pseudomonadota bacterium]